MYILSGRPAVIKIHNGGGSPTTMAVVVDVASSLHLGRDLVRAPDVVLLGGERGRGWGWVERGVRREEGSWHGETVCERTYNCNSKTGHLEIYS